MTLNKIDSTLMISLAVVCLLSLVAIGPITGTAVAEVQVPNPSNLYIVHSQGIKWAGMRFVKEANGRVVFTNTENKALVINGDYYYYEQ